MKPVLYGFSPSTYVRTVRCVLEGKGVAYDQIDVNVLAGEPRQAEHLARHPFGKVPVLDIDGHRLIETEAICRYLEDTHPSPAFVPATAWDRARMAMATNLVDSYGYGGLIGAAAHYLFPDFIGGANQEAHDRNLATGIKALETIMGLKGSDPWIAGAAPGLAEFHLGPVLFYSCLTPDRDRVLAVPGLADWWARLSAHPVFAATEPKLG